MASLEAPLSGNDGESAGLADVLPDLSSLQTGEQTLLKLDIDQALERLTPLLREVLVARFLTGESAAEIGRRFGCTEQTISAWVREAIREMKLHLAEFNENATESRSMKTEIRIEQLLRWRLAQAEAEAPPAPRAARLLELARPWWETWPAQFQALVERLGGIQINCGHAMAEPNQSRMGHPVPVIIVSGAEESEALARVLYLSFRDGRLHLRFQLETPSAPVDAPYEVTIVSDADAKPVFSARAGLSRDSGYRLDAELATEVAVRWERLKVTDRMPFRLILRSVRNAQE